ncbi:MAG: rod-binding protein [Acidobacteria bacterium]|nr:rod-binding protein [Acidobacteriota bacterium]
MAVEITSLSPSPAVREDPAKVKDAACQFEALLIGQMLKAAREAGSSGWLGTGEDHSGESALEMAEQQFAQVMAAQGGLGLARMVIAGLQHAEKAASTRD